MHPMQVPAPRVMAEPFWFFIEVHGTREQMADAISAIRDESPDAELALNHSDEAQHLIQLTHAAPASIAHGLASLRDVDVAELRPLRWLVAFPAPVPA